MERGKIKSMSFNTANRPPPRPAVILQGGGCRWDAGTSPHDFFQGFPVQFPTKTPTPNTNLNSKLHRKKGGDLTP